MIIPFTLLFGALGYLFYKSKDEVTLIERETSVDSQSKTTKNDDLYKDLEDLFI